MKRLLFIAHRVPFPPDKGERVRAFHEIRALADHFRVTLAALAHHADDLQAARGLEPWCERLLVARVGGLAGLARGALSLATGGSVTEGYFRSRRLLRQLRDAAGDEPFDIALAYSSSTLPYALAVPARRRVADLVDVDSAKWSAYAREARWPTSRLYRREARGVRRLEQRALDACDAVVLVSRAEAEALGAAGGNALPVANGVDTAYFAPPAREPVRPTSLVFTGTMDYRPNIDGVCWFVREVWPGLKAARPEVTLTIVGRDPAPAVRRLAETPGVTVTGSVPDVRPYLAEADAVVVPLRLARGIQNKVLEAMAMGRAVVASPAALEGLDVEVGTEVLEADRPEAWCAAIGRILDDSALRRRLGQAARACTEQRFNWDRRMADLVGLCRRLVSAPVTMGSAAAGLNDEKQAAQGTEPIRPEATAR